MFKNYMLILALGHVIGDFYTQTQMMAERKKKSFAWVGMHSLIYLITMLTVSIPFWTFNMIFLMLVASMSHGIIDFLKFLILKHKKTEGKVVLLLDQSLHILCIMVLAYIWTIRKVPLYEMNILKTFFETIGVSELFACKWILELLLIYKPTNILIQNMLKGYKPETKENKKLKDNKAGRMIGFTERLVMLVLLYLHQYSAIGFVLTAKSIARYDRISKDEQFAEYYLLGTLMSTGIVIISSMIIF